MPDAPVLSLVRRFGASPARVYAAWTRPEALALWWGPRHTRVESAEVDARVGGRFRVVLVEDNGARHEVSGAYTEVEPERRLVFTWNWADAPPGRESRVTVEFRPVPGGTELALTHDRFADADTAARHRRGWTESLERLAGEFANGVEGEERMQVEPRKEHRWLERFLGEWTYEAEATMAPGQPPMKSRGTESVRPLGGFWIVGEGDSECPGGGPARTLLTVGFDPRTGRFVGTWTGSMMAHLWVYDGWLDEAGGALTLEAEGPAFSGDGKMATYRDVTEFKGADHRVLTSQVRGEDGTWNRFMTAHYRRRA